MVLSTVTARILTQDLWDAACKLSVHAHQLKEVSTVSEALILVKRSTSKNPNVPVGVFLDEKLVGFLLLLCDTLSNSNFWISRFFIDKQFQGQGLGFKTIPQIIALLRKTFPNADRLNLCVNPSNTPARKLYKKCGFVEQQNWIINGDNVWSIDL